MYDQARGAREMARKVNLFARFEPLLEWPTAEQPPFDYTARRYIG